MLSYGLDRTVALMTSLQLLLPTQGLPMTEPVNTWTEIGEKSLGLAHRILQQSRLRNKSKELSSIV